MSELIHRNKFMNVHHDPELSAVVLEWTAETATMTDDDFKDALCVFAIYALRHRVPALVVDARAFHHSMSGEIGAWRDRTIIPRYNDAGCAKFAFILGEGAKTPPEQPAREDGPNYPTRFFQTPGEAAAWLAR